MKSAILIWLCAGLIFGVTACYPSEITLKLDEHSGSPAEMERPSTSQYQQSPKPTPTTQQSVTVGRVALVCLAVATIYRQRVVAGRPYVKVRKDTSLAIVASKDGWYGVLMANGKLGWIVPSDIKFTDYILVAKDKAAARSIVVGSGRGVTSGDLGAAVIRTAADYSGTRYVFGGNNAQQGMDCSAFVRTVFKQQGVSLPRTSREQAQIGETIPLDQLKPGDRLYFACSGAKIDHTGIYAGNGLFVHCSSRRAGVGVDSLASDFFWNSLVKAKRER